MKTHLFLLGALLCCANISYSQCACCAGAGSVLNADNTTGLLTLPKRGFTVDLVSDFRTIMVEEGGGHHGATEEGDAEETPLSNIWLNSVSLKYGITDRWMLSASIPHAILNTSKGSDNGLGDLMLMATHSVVNSPKINVAVSAGIELPTGVEKGSAFDESTVVVGSGSYDPVAAVSFSKKWSSYSLVGNVFHRMTTKGFENTTYSSVSLQSISLSRALIGHDENCQKDGICQDHRKAWNITAGYYGEWLGQIKEGDEVDPNSGYYLGFATIGTSLTLNKWAVPLTFSYPLMQQYNGDQNMAGYRLRIGLSRSF